MFVFRTFTYSYFSEYCKKIQEKEDLRRGSRYMSSSEEEASAEEDEDSLHHPFKVKEAAPIVMDIKVSLNLVNLSY